MYYTHYTGWCLFYKKHMIILISNDNTTANVNLFEKLSSLLPVKIS